MTDFTLIARKSFKYNGMQYLEGDEFFPCVWNLDDLDIIYLYRDELLTFGRIETPFVQVARRNQVVYDHLHKKLRPCLADDIHNDRKENTIVETDKGLEVIPNERKLSYKRVTVSKKGRNVGSNKKVAANKKKKATGLEKNKNE